MNNMRYVHFNEMGHTHAMVVQISVKSQLNNFFFLHFAQTKDQNAIKKHWQIF